MKKEKGSFEITPWKVSGKINYDKLIREFGLNPLRFLPKQFNKFLPFRRETIFAHRDFKRIIEAVEGKKRFAMMTGLMPSGKFHLGHMVAAEQIIFYQSLGAKVYVAVADIEAYNTRSQDMEELRKTAVNEYLINYIALGLKPKNCDFYFQSQRSKEGKKANAYYALANLLAKHVTFNEFKAIYGDISPGKMASALLQASDMLHPQLPEFEGGPLPIIIPVGADQDPHLRLARDVSKRIKLYDFTPISSTCHKLLPGLKGDKMSSSNPNSYIALTDSLEEVREKIIKHAFSGGRGSLAEHRKLGGNPDVDVSYQYLKVFFEPDDKKLKKIYDDYKSGAMLTSELKEYLIKKISAFLKEHQRKRKLAEKQIDKFVFKG